MTSYQQFLIAMIVVLQLVIVCISCANEDTVLIVLSLTIVFLFIMFVTTLAGVIC